MEQSWGREAVKFARRQVPTLLSTYEGDPADFFVVVEASWQAYVKLLQQRIDALPKDVPEGARMGLAQQALGAEQAQEAAQAQAHAAKAGVAKVQEGAALAKAAAKAAQEEQDKAKAAKKTAKK